jgi:hypothetical protein
VAAAIMLYLFNPPNTARSTSLATQDDRARLLARQTHPPR